MKIAIVSDIHDQISNLRAALKKAASAEVLICCGDLCSPFVAKELGQGFHGPIHVVFGNNDGDRFRIAAGGAKYPHLLWHGEFVLLELDGKRIAVNHFDNIGRALAEGEAFDVVCFGHNHQFELTRLSRTLLINPGEIYGELTGRSTFVIYDTQSHDAERVDL